MLTRIISCALLNKQSRFYDYTYAFTAFPATSGKKLCMTVFTIQYTMRDPLLWNYFCKFKVIALSMCSKVIGLKLFLAILNSQTLSTSGEGKLNRSPCEILFHPTRIQFLPTTQSLQKQVAYLAEVTNLLAQLRLVYIYSSEKMIFQSHS